MPSRVKLTTNGMVFVGFCRFASSSHLPVKQFQVDQKQCHVPMVDLTSSKPPTTVLFPIHLSKCIHEEIVLDKPTFERIRTTDGRPSTTEHNPSARTPSGTDYY